MAKNIVRKVLEQLGKKPKQEIEDGDYFVWGRGPLEWEKGKTWGTNPDDHLIVLMINLERPGQMNLPVRGSTKLLRIQHSRYDCQFYETGDKIRVVDGNVECIWKTALGMKKF